MLSLLAVLIVLLLPSLPYSTTVQTEINFDQLWRDNLFKQISGYSLLGLSLLISIISFRKRINKLINLWDFAYWRMTHIVIGFITIPVLLIHTGFRMGENLNFLLMMTYTALLLVGAIAGVAIGYEHRLPRRLAKQMRLYAVWSHIILLWPLPVLLGFHIVKTYFF
jgi:nitrite reductase (NADH) large subunit